MDYKAEDFVAEFVKRFQEKFPDAQLVIGATTSDNYVFTNFYAKSFGAIFWMTELIRDNCKKSATTIAQKRLTNESKDK